MPLRRACRSQSRSETNYIKLTRGGLEARGPRALHALYGYIAYRILALLLLLGGLYAGRTALDVWRSAIALLVP